MITTSTEWDRLSASSLKASIALVRMYYGDESSYIAIAEKEITPVYRDVSLTSEGGISLETEGGERLLASLSNALFFDGDHYLGILMETPELRSLINLEEHEHSVSTFTLIVSNTEYQPGSRFSDFITTLGSAGDYGFWNRRIEIRLYTEGITSWENCFPLFVGYVRGSDQSWDKVTFTCDDGSILQNTIIPNNAITADDIPGDTGLATGAEGKQKQIVYGSHRFFLGSLTGWVGEATQNNIMVKCTLLGLSAPAGSPPTSSLVYQVSGHLMYEIGSIWIHDPQINRFVKASSFDIIQNNASGCVISISQTQICYDYWFGDGTYTHLFGNDDWINLDRANNREYTNYFLAANQPTGITPSVDNNQELNFPVYDEAITDAQINDIRVLAYAVSDGTPAPFFQINSNDITPTAIAAEDFGSGGSTNAEVSAPVDIYYNGAVDKSAHLMEVYKQVEYLPSNLPELEVYASCRGMEYGSWIKSRTDHIDDGDSGGLIENAAGIIESVLRDQMGLVDANINLSAFNTLSNNISDFDLGFIIYDNTKSSNVLKMILKDCRTYLWMNSERKWTAKYIADSYASSDIDISFNEMQDVNFTKTKLEDIKPYITLNYFLSSIKNINILKYETTNSDILTYYNISEVQGTDVIETSTINSLTAATNLGNFEYTNRANYHNIIECTLNKLYLNLDLFDVISITDMPYKVNGEDIEANASRADQTIYKYWLIFDISRGERITIKAIQLHKLD